MSERNHTNRIPVVVIAVLILFIGVAAVFLVRRNHFAQIKENPSLIERTEEKQEKEEKAESEDDASNRDTLDALLDELQNLDNMLNEN